MAELEKTPNLGIPRILGNQPLVRQQFNGAIDELDKQALSVNHATTKAHFDLWKANTTYKLQDIVRTSTCPSWGFYMCTTPGTSGTSEPQGYGEGDEITDGTCVWKLKLFGGPTSINHGDLKFRNQPDQHSIEAITGLLEALSGKATPADIETAINNLIDGAPEALDTLKEIADALKNNDDVVAQIINTLAEKVDKVEEKGLSSNDYVNADKAKVDKISEIDGKFAYDGKTIIGGASDWETAKKYTKDELVVYDNKLYRCLANHTSTSFIADKNYWQEILGENEETPTKDVSTITLLHFNETGFKDECGNVWTAVGTPQINTTTKKFGDGSLYLDGSSYLSTPIDNNLNLSIGDFTIDWWEYRTQSKGYATALSFDNGNGIYDLILGYQEVSGLITCYASSNGTSWDILSAFSLGTIKLNTWVHRAIVRKGEIFYGFENGNMISTMQNANAVNFSALLNLQIGNRTQAVSGTFIGYIDEIRVSKIAQWTAPFTPPTQEYVLPVQTSTSMIASWSTNTEYRKNQVVTDENKRIYRCLTEHVSTEQFDSTKWEFLNGNNIQSMNYNKVTNTLDIVLTDGTTQSFDGLGVNYFGGFSQKVLWEGNGYTPDSEYTLSDTVENYDVILVISGIISDAKRNQLSTLIPKDNCTVENKHYLNLAIGSEDRKTIFSVYTDKFKITSITSTTNVQTPSISKIIGIKGKINNAGEPSRLIQDKLFSGNANAIGRYTLSKNINSYDYVMVVTAWGADTTKRRDTQIIYKGDYANTNQYWEIGTIANETRSLHYRVNNSTLTVITKEGGTNSPTIVEIIGVKYKEGSSAIAPDWATGKDYLKNQLVVYLGILCRCLSDHTSTDFASDKSYWEELSGGESGGNGAGNGDMQQVTKLGVIAPKIEEVSINYTNKFNLPPVEVLKFEPGAQDQVVTACSFNNSDATDFIYNVEFVEFDGTMRLKTVFDIPMSEPTILGDGYISESAEVDFSIYKKVTEVK